MSRKTALFALICSSLGASAVSAAPCADISGTWDFALQCVRVSPEPFIGPRSITGTVEGQDGCAFYGTLSGYDWVGVLHGDGNRSVASDFGNAKATGELSHRRAGLFRQMTLTYTLSEGDTGEQTACTGDGVRR